MIKFSPCLFLITIVRAFCIWTYGDNAENVPECVRNCLYECSEKHFVPSRSTVGRCKILRSIEKVPKPTIKPSLKRKHKMTRLDWANSYMKTNFENVLFSAVSGHSGSSRYLATQWYHSTQQDQATRRWRC